MLEQQEGTILYTSGRAGITSQLEHIKFAETQDRLEFEYMPSSLSEALESCRPFSDKTIASLSILENPDDALVVHTFSKRLGSSLTTRFPINKGTIILEYIGERLLAKSNTDKVHSIYAGPLSEVMKSHLKAFNNGKTPKIKEACSLLLAFHKVNLGNEEVISAAKKGNLSRFLSHMPNVNPFPDLMDIKLANLSLNYISSSTGYDRIFFVTTKDIEAYEELGFDYGLGYWKNRGELPVFFNNVTGDIHKISQDEEESPSALGKIMSATQYFWSATTMDKFFSLCTNTKALIVMSAVASLAAINYFSNRSAVNNLSLSIELAINRPVEFYSTLNCA